MKLDAYNPFSVEDYKDAPDWFKRFLEKLNGQMESLTTLNQGNVTVEDNLNSEIRELEVSDGVETSITLQRLRGKPQSALCVWTAHSSPPSLHWYQGAGEDQVTLSVTWASAPTEPTKVRIMFLGE